jgi:conjugal transfer/entry exclusion protein
MGRHWRRCATGQAQAAGKAHQVASHSGEYNDRSNTIFTDSKRVVAFTAAGDTEEKNKGGVS